MTSNADLGYPVRFDGWQMPVAGSVLVAHIATALQVVSIAGVDVLEDHGERIAGRTSFACGRRSVVKSGPES